MIPTTDAELLTFNTPGDVSRRILLEPFHFSWEISSNESSLTNLEAVGVDLSGNLRAIKRINEGYVQIYTVMDSGDPIEISPGSVVLSVKWFGDSYYYTAGTGVYRDGVLLFTANGIVDTIGVAADNDVYFSYRNSGTNHLAHYHDSAIEYSDVYWCGDIDNLDAIRLSDHDVIVMSCEFPANLVTDVESGEIVWVEEEHYGIAAMNVHGNLWSDHYTIDVNENENQIISSGHAFKISDTKVGVAYQSSIYGTLYNFFSTSVNGRTWIFPIPMIVPTPASQPLYIMKDNYVYAFGSGVIYKSPGFRLFGVQPEQYDITSNVLACSLVTDQRSGVTLEVNYSQELWNYLEEGGVLLQMYAGYVYSDASVEKLVFVGELDLHGKRANFEATNTVELPFRDVTSWLDRSKAPVSVEANAITTLLDNYDDPEGTGYGGLSRTAAYRGSWKTSEGQLTPLANGANVAFNTSGNSVNGEIAVAGTFTEPTTDILGVIYRGISDKHMMRLVYYASTQMLTLERANGEDNVTAIAAVGQSFSNQVAMIRAIFRYGLHIGQVSTDGISWSTVLTQIYGEHNYYGAMGLYANQYVPDTTDPWVPVWPDPPFVPPPLPIPPVIADWPSIVWVGTVKLGVYRTNTFTGSLSALQPAWVADNLGLPDMSLSRYTLMRFGADYSDPRNQMVVVKDTTPSPDEYTIYTRSLAGTWVASLTEAQAGTVAGAGTLTYKDAVYDVSTSTLYAVYGVTTATGPIYLLKSVNNGASWSLVSTTGSTFFYLGRIYVRGNEIAIGGGFSAGGGSKLRYSNDSGATFNISISLGGSAWAAYPFVLAGGKLFVNGNGINGPDLMDVNKASMLLTGLSPAPDLGPQNADALWEDLTDTLHQRILKFSKLWITTDEWLTVVSLTPATIVPTMERHFAPIVNGPDLIFYAQSFPGASSTYPHVLYITASEGGLLVERSGNDPLNPPYTDSIPNTCGGLCNGGLVVWQ